MVDRNLTTKDDVSLREIYDTATRTIDVFNNAEFPFRDLFVTQVGQQMFQQYPKGEFEWEELAEGESPRTAEMGDPNWLAVQVDKFGRSLGFTQEFIEDHDSEAVQRRLTRLVEGAAEKQRQQIMTVIDNGIADGRTLWYEVEDYGGYTHGNDPDHWFTSTSELSGDANSYTASKHIEMANDKLREYGRANDTVVLCGAPFKRALKDDLTWNANYRIPSADNLRSEDLEESDISVDGSDIIQTPWLTGNEFYVLDAGGEAPIKMHEKRPVQLTRPNGGPATEPGELLGASGTARYGFKFVDPVAGVYVSPDDISN